MGRGIERRRALALAIVAAVWAWSGASWAQTYPAKTVRYVVPFGAGGSPDLVARILTERLTRLWGQQVIVDNRVGVAGVLGTAFVAKSPPDGYTLRPVQRRVERDRRVAVREDALRPAARYRGGHAHRHDAQHHHRAPVDAGQDAEAARRLRAGPIRAS